MNSMTHRSREYTASYPTLNYYYAAFSSPSTSSPYRKTHYLDDSDEEVIHEEILNITNLDHYPTLMECWGDDAKTIVKQDGELIIEEYVEFEEIEPTVIEEIQYEMIVSGNEVKSSKEIHRSQSRSRNFRKIRKRRIKRKRQIQENQQPAADIDQRATKLLDDLQNLSLRIDSIIETGTKISNLHNDLSGDDDILENPNAKELESNYTTTFSISKSKSLIFFLQFCNIDK